MYRTTQEWEECLGAQIRRLRLQLDMSQREVGERCGLSTPTVARLESGAGSSTATLIKVLKVLRAQDWLETLVPPAPESPIRKYEGIPERRRASRGRSDDPRAGGR